MRFLRRNAADSTETAADTTDAQTVGDESMSVSKAHTPGKGRPTPKRREAEARRRGPVPPPPRTTREALRRSRGNKEERKAQAAKRRDLRIKQRAGMAAGDDKYLMPRDRGPVKAFVRDVVDSRRHLVGLFMPLAVLVFLALVVRSPILQYYSTLLTMVMLVAMIIEGVFNGARITRLARAKFPKENIKGLSIGMYAFMRASQIRKFRLPKPRVRAGDKIT